MSKYLYAWAEKKARIVVATINQKITQINGNPEGPDNDTIAMDEIKEAIIVDCWEMYARKRGKSVTLALLSSRIGKLKGIYGRVFDTKTNSSVDYHL